MTRLSTVFIIILNYNGKRVISRCLRSVQALEYARKEIVVVDNASTDGSFESVQQQFPQAHFIRNSENVGFARGANIGMRFALERGADFVWLLNSDAIVPKDALGRLESIARRHPNVGMLSPVIYEPRKAYQHRRHIWFGGGRINWLRMCAEHAPLRSRSHPFETGYLSGCALFIRAAALRTVGLFDERFFLYYEDADLSLRMKQEGYKIVISPHISAIHSEQSRENPEKTYWLVRSGLWFFRKHTPKALLWVFWIAFFLRMTVNRVRRAFRVDNADIVATGKAFQDFRTYGY